MRGTEQCLRCRIAGMTDEERCLAGFGYCGCSECGAPVDEVRNPTCGCRASRTLRGCLTLAGLTVLAAAALIYGISVWMRS